MLRLNILDYSPIFEGSDAREALLHTRELAKRADSLGYSRFWVSEHHNVFSVAGSTPEMLMMQLAAATNRIRIGSGGVMLPHYSPYKVAENFRMLEAFHPNRIDLGIGRSPGYPIVNRAMNENRKKRLPYAQQIEDLKKYLSDDTESEHRFKELLATPVIDTAPEMWMLGTSSRSARLAAEKGMAYSFAEFTPILGLNGPRIVKEYRTHFRTSALLKKPKVMVSIFVVVAETEAKAEKLAETLDAWLLAIESGEQPKDLPALKTALNREHSPEIEDKIKRNRRRAVVGTPDKVKRELLKLAEAYETDEVTLIPQFYGKENRLKAIELLAEAFDLN